MVWSILTLSEIAWYMLSNFEFSRPLLLSRLKAWALSLGLIFLLGLIPHFQGDAAFNTEELLLFLLAYNLVLDFETLSAVAFMTFLVWLSL